MFKLFKTINNQLIIVFFHTHLYKYNKPNSVDEIKDKRTTTHHRLFPSIINLCPVTQSYLCGLMVTVKLFLIIETYTSFT